MHRYIWFRAIVTVYVDTIYIFNMLNIFVDFVSNGKITSTANRLQFCHSTRNASKKVESGDRERRD